MKSKSIDKTKFLDTVNDLLVMYYQAACCWGDGSAQKRELLANAHGIELLVRRLLGLDEMTAAANRAIETMGSK